MGRVTGFFASPNARLRTHRIELVPRIIIVQFRE